MLRRYRIQGQRWLRWFLLFGTVFAFTVFGYEAAQFYHWIGGPSVGCVFAPVSPFQTPCFYGGLFFLASFITSVVVVRTLDGGQKQRG
jgi:hypothetical protein